MAAKPSEAECEQLSKALGWHIPMYSDRVPSTTLCKSILKVRSTQLVFRRRQEISAVDEIIIPLSIPMLALMLHFFYSIKCRQA